MERLFDLNCSDRNHLCRVAREIIESEFDNKTDKAGALYINHLWHVARRSYEISNCDVNCCVVGLLHDLLEDIPSWTSDRLIEIFPTNIVEAVAILTKADGVDYDDYIKRISENQLARYVKIADLEHNMDMTRIKKELTQNDIDRIIKYHKSYLKLKNTY